MTLGPHHFLLLKCDRLTSSSDERLSLQESMTSQARAYSAARLWRLEIAALTFEGVGIAIIVFDPSNRVIAFSSIVFFGVCAALIARMLLLRRRG